MVYKKGAHEIVAVGHCMVEDQNAAVESKVTYAEIKAYVKEQTGLQFRNLYIAQVKKKCGVVERVNHNLSKSEDSKQLSCPSEKERAAIRRK